MLLAAGVSVIFMVHIFINIGMTLGITPVTGLPLPMLSYGGSFVISCCVLQGLLQSTIASERIFMTGSPKDQAFPRERQR